MTILIVDDEQHCRNVISRFLQESTYGQAKIIKASGVIDAEKKFQEFQPNLIFLDIQMNDGTGFDFLKRIEYQSSQVIFTTAYDDFAIKAFEVNAIHYLLKPISKEDFLEALSRYSEKDSGLNDEKLKALESVEIMTPRGRERIYTESIKLLESAGAYTKIYLDNGENYISSKKLGFYEELLAPMFFRVHRSYIIHLRKVKKTMLKDYSLKLEDGHVIPISRRKRREFLDAWKPSSS